MGCSLGDGRTQELPPDSNFFWDVGGASKKRSISEKRVRQERSSRENWKVARIPIKYLSWGGGGGGGGSKKNRWGQS